MENKILIPVKFGEKGNSAWIDITELKIIEKQIHQLQYTINTYAEANKTLLKEIKRLKFMNERYIQAGKQQYLNVVLDTNNTHIKNVDKIAMTIVNQEIPTDIDNECYFVDGNGKIKLDEMKMAHLTEVM